MGSRLEMDAHDPSMARHLLLTLLIVLPWGIAIAFESHGEFYAQSLGHDFAAKILGGQETHGAPPGYYLALASVTLWPAILFALPGVGWAVMNRKDPVLRYLLAWAGACWLMFEIVPTKLPHYILPAYPAVAFMGALWAMRPRDEAEPGWLKVLRYLAAFQFLLGVLAFAAALLFLPQHFGGHLTLLLIGGAVHRYGVGSRGHRTGAAAAHAAGFGLRSRGRRDLLSLGRAGVWCRKFPMCG